MKKQVPDFLVSFFAIMIACREIAGDRFADFWGCVLLIFVLKTLWLGYFVVEEEDEPVRRLVYI
jgi:hypothetical protein